MQIGSDQVVDGRIGVRDVAMNLRLSNSLGRKGEWNGFGVTRLNFEIGEVDRAAIQAAGRARLEPGQFEAAIAERNADRLGR